MKCLVLKSSFQEGIAIGERIAARSFSLPILQHIFLGAEKNLLEIRATDLEVGLRYTILAKNEEVGSVAILGKTLVPFVSLVPEVQLRLESKDQNVEISARDFRAVFRAGNVQDFPIIPSPKGEELEIVVPVDTFVQGLARVAGFVGQSQARPEISGVLMVLENKELHLVSTDSFRLAEARLLIADHAPSPFHCILPPKTAREIGAIFGARQGPLRILFSPTQIFFEYGGKGAPEEPSIQLVSRVLEGEYPKYQEVIPTSFQTQAILPREELLSHIRAASIFSGKISSVQLRFDARKKELLISTKSADVGESESIIHGSLQGKDAIASFNWKFLGDGLSQIKTREVEFHLSKEEGPALIKPVAQTDYLYVLMPLKL